MKTSEDLNYKKYLDPSVVSKLNSLELKARLVVEGFMVGLHKSPYHGFSAEFSEHRPYMQGDSIKNVDWKVYAKSEKYYVKQYEEETNLISNVILDVSRSMDFKYGNSVSKLEYGSMLAASLIYIMLRQQDAAGLALFSDSIQAMLPPKSNRAYIGELLKVLSSIKPTNQTRTAGCLSQIAEKVKKRGLVIVISDFFDDIESVLKALKHFRYQKNEVIVFQLLDPLEMSFNFGSDAVFRDMETEQEITTRPYHIQKVYKEAMSEFLEKMKMECLNSGIEYNLIDTSTSFDKALLSYFKKRHKLV